MGVLDTQYVITANQVLKKEVNILQDEIIKEEDPLNSLFFTPGDGTVHWGNLCYYSMD